MYAISLIYTHMTSHLWQIWVLLSTMVWRLWKYVFMRLRILSNTHFMSKRHEDCQTRIRLLFFFFSTYNHPIIGNWCNSMCFQVVAEKLMKKISKMPWNWLCVIYYFKDLIINHRESIRFSYYLWIEDYSFARQSTV